MSEQAPKYLQNETTLKQEVSYSTREQIIRANRDFQMRNYTGTIRRKWTPLTLLRSNPELRDFSRRKLVSENQLDRKPSDYKKMQIEILQLEKQVFFRRLFGGGNSSKGRWGRNTRKMTRSRIW